MKPFSGGAKNVGRLLRMLKLPKNVPEWQCTVEFLAAEQVTYSSIFTTNTYRYHKNLNTQIMPLLNRQPPAEHNRCYFQFLFNQKIFQDPLHVIPSESESELSGIVTSAEEVMFSWRCKCLSACVSVCKISQELRADYDEIILEGWGAAQGTLIIFWWQSGDPVLRILSQFFTPIMHFQWDSNSWQLLLRCRSSVAVSSFCRCKIPLFCKNYVRKFCSVTAVNGKKLP